jgi:hypothetical protein
MRRIALLLPLLPGLALAQPNGRFEGSATLTWQHEARRCATLVDAPALEVSGAVARLVFQQARGWTANGELLEGGRVRAVFGAGTEIDVTVLGAVEGGRFRGVLRTPYCVFALDLAR